MPRGWAVIYWKLSAYKKRSEESQTHKIFIYYTTNYIVMTVISTLTYFKFVIFWIHLCKPRVNSRNTFFTCYFFFNKTFNIRLISVSSAESTFCVGTDVKRFSCVGMRVTDLSRLHCAAQTVLDRSSRHAKYRTFPNPSKSGEFFWRLT